ncbi:uncharacterized protein RHOBADRAFT_55175 [Rhodotorula graminis WP1]|uniref:Uncharacterized protein n=1 Tax=Rhodotorula graminis (strain WP1) TaxID=578459 RepID=A0A0P9EW38_RHOGW|nr:uncharacterized protein RHOBADRAFT_55175 [Rhodotorula graminis WP1]KPV73435.1 hypothetical protein RHOBADRAFT_55175 [Rhodotorula graminis WP1]
MPPPSPLATSSPTSAPPRRIPSRRVSALVSHFEAAASPAAPASAASTSPPAVVRPTSSTSKASRTRSEDCGGREEQSAMRPLGDPMRPVGQRRDASPGAGASVVVVGDVGTMDWAPVSPPTAAAAAAALSSVDSPFVRASLPALSAGGKAVPAPVVVVPASVSPARDGRPTLTVARHALSFPVVPAATGQVVVDGRSAHGGAAGAAQVGPRRDSSSSSSGNAEPPSPSSPSSPTSDAPPLRYKSVSTRPTLEPRRSSVTWAELIQPERDSIDLGDDSASILSSLSAAPLIPHSAPPARPPHPRAAPKPRSVDAPPTASSSRFTITSTSTASTRRVYAYELFARGAETLVLPELDAVIESLGGAAHFSSMPGPSGGRRRREEVSGKGEAWELETLEQSEGGRAEKVFGSELEREGWDKWVRGEQPSRWRRLVASAEHALLALLTRRRLDGQDEPDTHAVAARAAGMSRDQYIRSLKFPPFHLLPPKLTVTDLKANRRAPPPLIGVQGLLGAASNGLLGAASSSMGLKLTSVEGLRDLMQMVTLLVTAGSPSILTHTSTSTGNETLRTLFVKIPSVLSLEFVSAFGQPFALLLAFTLVTLFALYEFYRLSGGWHGPAGKLGRGELDLGEGYEREDLEERRRKWRDSYTWRVAVTFWCSSLFLPLSKLAIGAVTWTDDFWVVENPYDALGVDGPAPAPLGPADMYYAPMDFCWRTTMRRRDGARNINAAYALVPLAVVVLVLLALWFPWRMWQLVRREAPFLYRDYRRKWAAFRSIYLIFKLVNVILVVLIQKNNCLFREYGETYLSVVRQGCVLGLVALFCIASAISSPYLTRISNSSDIVSRIGYVFLALLGLLSALSAPGTDPAVIAVNVVVYSLNIYFTLIGLGLSQRLVKKARRRLDSSIDLFSPSLDVSKHIVRRVWQESVAALLLCSPEFAMPSSSRLDFSQDPQLPPYLLHFGGSVAERLIENLKILREIGLDAYADAESCPSAKIIRLRRQLELHQAGPDVYFRPEDSPLPVSSYFGRLDIVPFPFVAVFRYDQEPTRPLHLVQLEDLELLIEQNGRPDVVAARRVRLALRALENQIVFAPHVVVTRVGATGHTVVERHVSFRMAAVRLKRNSTFAWRGYQFASGFEVSLEYADGEGSSGDGRSVQGQRLVLTGPQAGVSDDFQLTHELALLLRRNRVLVEQRLPVVERSLIDHRDYFRREADLKRRTLSYSFLLKVFADDRLSLDELDAVLRSSEQNPSVQQLARSHKASTTRLEQRMRAVSDDKVRAWWYLVWDDLWRRNHDIGLPDEAFCPHYSSSVCYRPLARAQLEKFLGVHGLAGFFHSGFLNKLYFHLEEQVFSSTSRAIPIHLSSSPNRIPFDDLAHSVPHHHSSMPTDRRDASTGSALTASTGYTGGGTSEDDPSVRHRAAFLFEEAYEQPSPRFRAGSRAKWARFQVEVRAAGWAMRFFGLEPVVRDWRPSEDEGIVLNLRRGRRGWEVPRASKGVVTEAV